MIAISYRREDSLPIAGRLYDRLQAKFGKKNVFMDFDSIPPGADFRQHIKQNIEQSNLVIAMIGPHWLGQQPDASRRIDNLADFVRLEITYALEGGIPVIPLLINNTQMPKPEILPLDIQELAFRHALPLDSGMDFHSHAERLIRVILPKFGPPLPTPGARSSTSRSESSASLRSLERIIPTSAQSRTDTGIRRTFTQDVASAAVDIASIDGLHPKVVIKAHPSPQPSSTTLHKIEAIPSREPSSSARRTKRRMWGWSVAMVLFILLVLAIILQRPSPKSQHANAPTTPAPEISVAPTMPSSPSARPDQRDYALSKSIQAKQAFQQHDLTVARELIDQADAADPNQPAILNLRGEILTEQKEYELAEAAFRKAIEIDPNFYDAKNNLANLLSKKRKATPAPLLIQAVRPSPTALPAVIPQIAPTESPTVVERMPGEQFPETRSRLMTSWEVESWTAAQLRYAINEMYARHGADFLDKQIRQQFSAFEWYHPRPGQNYDQTEKLFSQTEVDNLKLLGYYRDARKAGPSPGSPSGGSSPPSDSTPQQTARKPKFLYAPHPTYPPGPDKMHVTGSGRFKITFDERGNAKSVEIVQSTGNRVLDGNTIKTLKRWRVAPGSPFYVVVPIDYRQKRQTRPKPRANASGQYQAPTPQNPQTVFPPGNYPQGEYHLPSGPGQGIAIDPHGPGTR
jgi:TonB family protein